MRGWARHPSEYADDMESFARKVWQAQKRGTGIRLTADEVVAVHVLMADGDWWMQFAPTDTERN